MKLLYVQDSLGTGGAERSNSELWYYLRARKDVEFKVVVLEHRKEGIEREMLKTGFDVTFLSSGKLFSQVKEIRKIIKEYDPDIVHSVLFRSAIRVRIVRMIFKFYHIESLVNCSYSPIRYKDPKINSTGLTIFKYINRYTQGIGTDKFIAITEEVKRHAVEYLKISPKKISVIPRGRKENPFLPLKKSLRAKIVSELNIEEPAVIIIHVGRQEYQKGHMVLLRAINEVFEELTGLNAHFLFCGREGNATGEIKNYLKNNKITERLHWLGHRHDILELLAVSDIFVFPSLFEGLGGALIEAQAAGLPVICSKINVFEEVVQENRNALMFRLEDSREFAGQIKRLARDCELQERMGKESLLNFRNKFNIDQIHTRVLTLYKKSFR